jgi:hypothetical protein
MPTLEHRIDALERATPSGPGYTIIAIQVLQPGNLSPENWRCEIDGQLHRSADRESASEFEDRMRQIAEALNQRLGKPIRIICSPTDVAA